MKINYMGRQINGRFSSFKSAVRRFVRWSIKWSVISGALIACGALFFSSHSTTVAVNEVKVNVPTNPDFPVLQRIAQCESDNKHYGKSGQVLMMPNTNGTVDVGRYQINTVWFGKATEMGLDITKEEDNRKMAEYIYTNHGTEPWYPSKKCWSK